MKQVRNRAYVEAKTNLLPMKWSILNLFHTPDMQSNQLHGQVAALLNKSYRLAPPFGVTKFITINAMNLIPLSLT